MLHTWWYFVRCECVWNERFWSAQNCLLDLSARNFKHAVFWRRTTAEALNQGYNTKRNKQRVVKTPGGRAVFQTLKKKAKGPHCHWAAMDGKLQSGMEDDSYMVFVVDGSSAIEGHLYQGPGLAALILSSWCLRWLFSLTNHTKPLTQDEFVATKHASHLIHGKFEHKNLWSCQCKRSIYLTTVSLTCGGYTRVHSTSSTSWRECTFCTLNPWGQFASRWWLWKGFDWPSSLATYWVCTFEATWEACEPSIWWFSLCRMRALS